MLPTANADTAVTPIAQRIVGVPLYPKRKGKSGMHAPIAKVRNDARAA